MSWVPNRPWDGLPWEHRCLYRRCWCCLCDGCECAWFFLGWVCPRVRAHEASIGSHWGSRANGTLLRFDYALSGNRFCDVCLFAEDVGDAGRCFSDLETPLLQAHLSLSRRDCAATVNACECTEFCGHSRCFECELIRAPPRRAYRVVFFSPAGKKVASCVSLRRYCERSGNGVDRMRVLFVPVVPARKSVSRDDRAVGPSAFHGPWSRRLPY